MPIDITLLLRELLLRPDIDVIHYKYRRPDRLHRITAQRWEGEGDEARCLSQEVGVSDEYLERIEPTVGERGLKRYGRELLSKKELARDA